MRHMKSSTKLLVFFLLSFAVVSTAYGQQQKEDVQKKYVNLKYGSQYEGRRQDPAMKDWRDNRLGQFIHWGLYAIPGGVWEGKVYSRAAEWLPAWADISPDEWTELVNKWNPENFDAERWAQMAKEAGFKLMVITTKHHDGFCLWPSKYTKFDVASAPNKIDIIGELIDAYTEVGIDVHFYYSIIDWHHPDYRSAIESKEDKKAFEQYKTFVMNQLKELVKRYPKVKGFWFDGTWISSVKNHGKWTLEIQQMLRSLKPGIIVNSFRADGKGSRHFDSNGNLMGDYLGTYEQKVPDFYEDKYVTELDWQASISIPYGTWGYHKYWGRAGHIKSTNEVLKRIVLSVAMGGNILVNFGPKPDGTFRKKERVVMEELGEWMDVNGEAIYAGTYLDWEKQPWGYYIADLKTDEVYAVVFNVPIIQKITVATPEGVSIAKAIPLNNRGMTLTISEKASDEVFIHLPKSMFERPYVIKLKVENNQGN